VSGLFKERGFTGEVWEESGRRCVIAKKNLSRPTVALALIVKNEEDTIERCIESFMPMDLDEILICDTGSDDSTVEKVKSLGAKVVFFKWVGDFSIARNTCLDHVQSAVIFMPDADERLRNPEVAKKFIPKWPEESESAMVDQWWNMDEMGSPGTSFRYPKLFRNLPGVHYVNPVHNVLHASALVQPRDIVGEDIVFVHDPSPQKEEKKRDRGAQRDDMNLITLGEKVEANSKDARSHYYYGLALQGAARWEEAIEIFTRYIEIGWYRDEVWNAHTRLARCCLNSGSGDKFVEWMRKAKEYDGKWAETDFHLGIYYKNGGDWEKAREHFAMAAGKALPDTNLFIDRAIYEWRAKDELALMCYRLGDLDRCIELYEELVAKLGEKERLTANLSAAKARKALEAGSGE